METLPIDALLPSVIDTLRRHSAAVLRAPPGAGKTTRIPPALLDAGLPPSGRLILLQPRRLAAQAAAMRIAEERGGRIGEEVGYQVRFERRSSRQTRILAMTTGLFLRWLQDDPFLEGVGLVVFDEFHERSADADLALALVRKVQLEVRPELRLLVMSATLAGEAVAEYLGGCPLLESPGRAFPVAIEYHPRLSRDRIEQEVADAVPAALAHTAGDVLAFLPGVGEIRRTRELLAGRAETRDVALVELYGDMPLDKQRAVLRPGGGRKVVLATNVAETSLTLPNVTAVVDSGLARSMRFDPHVGLNRLELGAISKASAEQRAGRAGRTAPGRCYRLWTEREHSELPDFDRPEMLRVDLAEAVLQLVAWGEREPRAFPWVTRPSEAAFEQAERLLNRLGAILSAEGERSLALTDIGRRMVALPVHPRIGRLLVEAEAYGVGRAAALVAALLSERDPFLRNVGPREVQHVSDSDLLDRLAALEQFERDGRRESAAGVLDAGGARFVLRARDQLSRMLRPDDTRDTTRADDDDDLEGGDFAGDDYASGAQSTRAAQRGHDTDAGVLRSIAVAFGDRLARRRERGGKRAVMVGGRGVRLHPRSAVARPELFACIDIDEGDGAEAVVRIASGVEREWLPQDRVTQRVDVEFDAQRERVSAVRRTCWFDLVLEEAAVRLPPDVDLSPVIVREALARLSAAQVLNDDAAGFLARWQCLAGWMPELALPELGEEPWRTVLPALAAGCVSFEELRRVPAVKVLRGMLDSRQLAMLEREAPERVTVPSGNSIALTYEVGRPPVLAVKIQEMFGLRQTPRVAGGRVKVLLHLLAPNMRPQQVTDDLESFWSRTYAEVRKELRARYPKHSWPEDPTHAEPQRRPAPRKSS